MYTLKLGRKIFIRLLLIVILIPLQSCSNTVIGEKLESSFDDINNQLISGNNNIKNKSNKIKKVNSNKKTKNQTGENIKVNILKEKIVQSKDISIQKSTKSFKKVIFNPQPYRIILKLSGANPSAPAETVTKALRKAGVQFEVEKIERFDEKDFLKNTSLKR